MMEPFVLLDDILCEVGRIIRRSFCGSFVVLQYWKSAPLVRHQDRMVHARLTLELYVVVWLSVMLEGELCVHKHAVKVSRSAELCPALAYV